MSTMDLKNIKGFKGGDGYWTANFTTATINIGKTTEGTFYETAQVIYHGNHYSVNYKAFESLIDAADYLKEYAITKYFEDVQ